MSSLCLWIAAALLMLQTQPPQPPDRRPTFRSATALVEVDIIARDRNDRFVPNLTAADFEIFEDGRPQTIEHFYLVTRQRDLSSAPAIAAGAEPLRAPDRTERRVFVFFFDSDHLAGGSLLKLKHAAMDFVNSELRPDDFGGVYVNGVLVNGRLTNQKQELLDAIRGAEPATDNVETRIRALLEFPRIGSYQEAAQIESGDRSTLADVGQRACGGDEARLCAAEGGREFVEDKLLHKARLFVDQSRHAANATLRSMSYVVRNLSGLDGRKTMMLLSEGFLMDDARSSLQQLAGQASRAGVTIYCLDARGTNARGGTSPAADPTIHGGGLSGVGDTSDEALDVLAAQTGGLTMRRRDDFRRALADIGSDTSTYYVLAYTPQNPALDGKYRRITLKLKRDGVTMRARSGYGASPLPPRRAIRSR
jgi:VWFA-related protein